MVVSMTQLATYDQAKTALTPILGDNKGTHLASAVTAAVVYSFASLPLVRSQNQLSRTVLNRVPSNLRSSPCRRTERRRV